MVLPIPRVKPLGWVDDELLTAAQVTQMDLNISLLDGAYTTFQHSSAMQFIRTDLVVGTSTMTFLSTVQQTAAIGTAANRQKSILIGGASSGSLAQGALVNDGTVPPAAFDSLAGAIMNSAPASDGSGAIFVGISGGAVIKSTDGLATTSSVTVTGSTTDINWVGFTTAHYLAFEASSHKLYIATALGGTWTNTTLTSLTAMSDLITDGAGNWVLVGNVSAAAVTYYSTDDGATWTFGASLSNGSCSGCYSAVDGKFYVLTALGLLYSSPTGVTWTLVKTMAFLTGANGVLLGQNGMVACGAVLACRVGRLVNSLGKYPNGIAYTLDRGANWNEVYFGAPTNKPLTNLISANGRIYAIDGAALYQSGVLESPPAVFTGV